MKMNTETNGWKNAERKSLRIQPEIRIGAGHISSGNFVYASYWVKGSTGNFYHVLLWENEYEEFQHTCRCRAGIKGFICYHVVTAWNRHCDFVNEKLRPTFTKERREASAFLFFFARFKLFVCAPADFSVNASRFIERCVLSAMPRYLALIET